MYSVVADAKVQKVYQALLTSEVTFRPGTRNPGHLPSLDCAPAGWSSPARYRMTNHLLAVCAGWAAHDERHLLLLVMNGRWRVSFS